jgi:hypothetical protein
VIAPPCVEGKINANIRAIELLKQLEAGDRNPTPEEKKVLAQYVGRWILFHISLLSTMSSQIQGCTLPLELFPSSTLKLILPRMIKGSPVQIGFGDDGLPDGYLRMRDSFFALALTGCAYKFVN